MLKYLSIIVSFILCTTCYSQKPLKEYKNIADQVIKAFFSRAVFKKIKCDNYFAQGAKGGGLLGGYYNEDKDKKVDVNLIAIGYSFYSKELDLEFGFNIDIDSIWTIYTGFKDIPPCVRKNEPCHYISKNQAIIIAQKDSIQYPDNLLVELEKPERSDEFYWVVSGQYKGYVDYNSEKPKGGWSVFGKTKTNTRYIHAITGNILSFGEYQIINKRYTRQ